MRAGAKVTRILVTILYPLCLAGSAAAAINAFGLGANFDSTQTNAIFRVYSSRATRIEVYLYAVPMGSPEVLHLSLNPDSSTKIFSISVPLVTIRSAGIIGPVYYGYR